MPLTTRWKAISESRFPWEREALDYLRERLPDQEPYRAWANFEFVAADGSINEVDLAVLAPAGFFLVEIKSHHGTLQGDVHTWRWTDGTRETIVDNPLILANQKAKKLASLLKHQPALKAIRAPFLTPVVFCATPGVKIRLAGAAALNVFERDRGTEETRERGIVAKLTGAPDLASGGPRVDSAMARAVARAMEQAGVRESNRSRRVGDYELGDLLFEGPAYQDYHATHVALRGVHRRVRLYPIPPGAGPAERETIRRAAQREFQILEGIHHPGLLRALEYKDHERGAALVFEHDPEALRLDHFVRQHGARLGSELRLLLLRQIAEAVQYAHEKRLVHRALSPQSILVSAPSSLLPRVQILNWQSGYRRAAGTTAATPRQVTATSHLEALVEDAATVYMAPEAAIVDDGSGEHVDVFSLGAIAYFLFAGAPPASSTLELTEKLRASKGLSLSAAIDGASGALEELIQFATHPDVSSRLDSAAGFVELLAGVDKELAGPEEDVVQNPIEAKPGSRLRHGFTLRGRLGQGSTAVALLVERDGKTHVLKVASDPEHNDRLRGEAAVLSDLRHQCIVELIEELEFDGRVGLLMERAGEETLAKRLRQDGPLHLELLQRFGDDLLTAVNWLEQKGIPHRDIKPENIGIGKIGRGDQLHLVLFDFSLSRTPPEAITAGTRPYLDPFITLRGKPPRWDLHAERFAAAVTLYQMATGELPVWGDRRSDPALIEAEATIEIGRFDPNLRDDMAAFFRRALARRAEERFDNGEQMLHAWRRLFRDTDRPATVTETGDAGLLGKAIEEATLDTPLARIGLSTRALNALERAQATSVHDLLRLPARQVYAMPGVGAKTRREVADAIRLLSERFPPEERLPKPSTTAGTDTGGDEASSIDRLVLRLKPRSKEGGGVEERAIGVFLGLDEGREEQAPGDAAGWPNQTQVAEVAGVTRARVSQLVARARGRWAKDPAITRVRADVAATIDASGGVMTVAELAQALLARRGSVQNEPHRSVYALAVARAALEAEREAAEPRFRERRAGDALLVAASDELADYALDLGEVADRLAAMDPLPAPARVLSELQEIEVFSGAPVLPPARLVTLAAAVSRTAAVSPRLEIYPHGMAAGRAVALALGTLAGVDALTPAQVQERVAGRYPEAERLPARPALDALLKDAGWDADWNPDAAEGRGAYVVRTAGAFGVTSETFLTRVTTTRSGAREVTPEVADARRFEERLEFAVAHGSFLALKVKPRLLLRAERELASRFPVVRQSIETLLIGAMKEEAARAGADWEVVIRADAAPRESGEWRNLMALVQRAVASVERRLLEATGERTLLLVNPGLLARYGHVGMLSELQQRVGRPGMPKGAWVLVPGDEGQALPVLDGRPIPVITAAQWATIPEPWVQNVHRGRPNPGAGTHGAEGT
jgi:serine/threonine protein kinase